MLSKRRSPTTWPRRNWRSGTNKAPDIRKQLKFSKNLSGKISCRTSRSWAFTAPPALLRRYLFSCYELKLKIIFDLSIILYFCCILKANRVCTIDCRWTFALSFYITFLNFSLQKNLPLGLTRNDENETCSYFVDARHGKPLHRLHGRRSAVGRRRQRVRREREWRNRTNRSQTCHHRTMDQRHPATTTGCTVDEAVDEVKTFVKHFFVSICLLYLKIEKVSRLQILTLKSFYYNCTNKSFVTLY